MKQGFDLFLRNGKPHLSIWGRDEKELFSHGLLALASFIRPDVSPKGKTVRARTHVTGRNLSETLEKFLSQVIFENEIHEAVFSAMDIVHLSPEEIECELIGKNIDHAEEEVDQITLLGKGIEFENKRFQAEGLIRLL